MGMLIGTFLAFILLASILIFQFQLDIMLITNIVIALATATAAIIHWDSVKKQRKDRLWEINKDVLIDLTHSLSLVIKASEYYLEEEYIGHSLDSYELRGEKPDPRVFKKFTLSQEYALNVYRYLMDQELIRSIESAKEKNNRIDKAVNDESIEHTEAYEESIESYKLLQGKLQIFMGKMSGATDR